MTHASFAQETPASVYMKFGKGIKFSAPDSLYTLTIGGRIQSLFETRSNLQSGVNGADFLLRRCRLNFQGTAFHPNFSFRIQIGFAHGDITSGNRAVQNNLVLRDAMFFYKVNKWLRFGFGQTKLPGNRQRQISSANLQLVERSISNNNFTLDRDKGIWMYSKFKINRSLLTITGAISSGEGRIASDRNGKLAYASRMEFLPFGAFSQNGEYVEGDLSRESKPKLSLAAVYSFNDRTSRTMGQLGDFLYNSEKANIEYYGADVLFKYKGFSLSSEFYTRNSNRGLSINAQDSTQQINMVSGTSFMVQSGIFVSKKNEIAIRYAQINPNAMVAALLRKQQDYTLGFSHYFNKHSLKIQTDLTYSVSELTENLIYRLSAVITF